MNWIRVEDKMPEPGVPVLAYVVGDWLASGKRWTRRIRAQYAAKGTLELSDSAWEDGDYDEATDRIYAKPGWYEDNEYEETHWRVTDPVTHWMPLPDPPEA